MKQLSSKNDGSSFCYDVIVMMTSTFLKLTNLMIFRVDIDYNSRTDVFRDVILTYN